MSRTQMAEQHPYYEPQDRIGLYLVRTPPSDIPYTCDIFILHGLNGGTAKTFAHPQTGAIWFLDFLADHVRDPHLRTNARIWVYGYNADVAFQNAGNVTAFNYANDMLERVYNVHNMRNKIIWICHSLGGILAKTALVQAKHNDRYTSILRSTIGILFIGTPHQGSGLANVADVSQRIAEVVLLGTYKPKLVITGLKKNCDTLFERANTFANVCNGIRIFGFFETRGTVIVTMVSAATNLQGEVLQSLDATHGDLCKFSDRSDPNFAKIRDAVRELMRLTAPPRPVQASWGNLPYPSGPAQPPYRSNYQETSHSYTANTGVSRAPPYAYEQSRQQPGGPSTSSSYTPYPGQPNQSGPPPTWQTPPSTAAPTQGELSPHAPTRDYTQSQPPEPTKERTSPAVPPKEPSQPPSRNRSPERSSGSHSVPPPQKPNTSSLPSAYRTSRSDPQVPQIHMEHGEPEEASPWTCDACMGKIPPSDPRIHCTVCDDYDLCVSCYQLNRTSKSHVSTHNVKRIKKTVLFGAEDFCHPSEVVNPDLVPGTSLPNWTIDEKDIRWNHLRKTDSHDRYLMTNVDAGHYAVEMIIEIRISNKLNAGNIHQLNGQSLGKCRVIVGFPKSKDVFLHESFTENDDLKSNLFTAFDTVEFKLMPGHHGVQRIPLPSTTVFNIDNAKSQVGIVVQWSEMRGFKTCDDAMVQLSINQVRLNDLLEWQPSTPTPKPTPQQAADEDDQVNELIGSLFIGALMEKAAEEQRLERLRQARAAQARQQEEERQQALQLAILQAAIQARQEEEEEQERQRLLALMLLGRFAGGR